jgi:pimeloyl-ACP methyl ester carboxylesterase
MITWILGVIVGLAGIALCGLVLFTAWTARQVEKQLPPVGRFINVDGARIHYLDEGIGPPVLLVHGLAGQMHNFTHSLLGRLLKYGFRVIILDRPGSGYSTRPPQASAKINAQARVISRFCEEVSLERPLVVGHSLGGAIALALALNHPDQVAGLALVAPATQRPDCVPPPFDGLLIFSPLLRRLIAWTVVTPLSMANSKRTLAMLFGPQPVPRDFAVKGGGMLSLRPASFIGASTDLVATQGEQGKAFAAKVKGAELELIEGGGHMIPVTSADRTAAFIARMAGRSIAAGNEPAPAVQD